MNDQIDKLLDNLNKYEKKYKITGKDSDRTQWNLKYNVINDLQYKNERKNKLNHIQERLNLLKEDDEMTLEITDYNNNIMEYTTTKGNIDDMMHDINALAVLNDNNDVDQHYYMMTVWMILAIVFFIGLILTIMTEDDVDPLIMILIVMISLYGGFNIVRHILYKLDK
jgi:hypothetical protein